MRPQQSTRSALWLLIGLIVGISTTIGGQYVSRQMESRRVNLIDTQVVSNALTLQHQLLDYYDQHKEFPKEAFIRGGWEQVPQHWVSPSRNAFGHDGWEPSNVGRPGGIVYASNNNGYECAIIAFGHDGQVVFTQRLGP